MRVYKAATVMSNNGYTQKACGIAGLNLIAVITETCQLDGSGFKVAYSSNGSDSRGATKIKVELYARKGKGKFEHVRSTHGALSPLWSDDSKEAINHALESAAYIDEEDSDNEELRKVFNKFRWLKDGLELAASDSEN